MKKFALRFLVVAGVLVCSFTASAASRAQADYALVDSVRMPAWVERQGTRQPLEPGMALRNRDRVLTGSEARVLVALADGSAVKLGENAQLDINALGRREGREFTAALDVARGAFRFTSGVFSTRHEKRAVNIRIGTIVAGVRGTDLWGKADEERDLICLVEGRISVFHAPDEPREMSAPLSTYEAGRDSAPGPEVQTDRVQFDQWAAQTEIRAGSGYARRLGAWQVELALVEGEQNALALYDLARGAGYAVRIRPQRGGAEGYRYSVRVVQLSSLQEASALAEKLKASLDLATPRAIRH